MTFRRFLMLSALTLGFAVSAPSTAKADPITAAIVTYIGVTGTAAAVATFVINSALYAATSFALGKVAGALSGKNKQGLQERQASVTSLSLGEVPREAVIGMPCVGGSLVDVWNWGGQYGTDNVTRCIALADHAVEDLYGYYVDDTFYLYTGSGVQPGFNGTLTIDFRNATADGHAPPPYASDAGWEPGDRMTAMTHVWVTTKYDEKVWTQGHPRFRWVMHGLRAFDPRNGDVWEDRETHSFTRNPTLLRYAIARGIYAEGHQGEPEHLLIGRGLSDAQAPAGRLIAPANLCDEAVDGVSRYYVDGVISADMDFITVEQMFADAMAGTIIQHEGGVEVEPGQAKAVVATITDADLVVGEKVTFSEFLPDSDGGRINTVVPRYVSPALGYADHSGPVRRNLADVIKDGGPRETTLAMPLVTGDAVADRNAEIMRRMSRLERRASVVLPAWFGWLEEGDWIAWQSDRRHGGATVRYRIEGWTIGQDRRMRLSLREIATSVFGVPDPIEDTTQPPPPPVPVDALTLPGASAESIILPGEASIIPAVRFHWDTPVDAAMRSIRAEVRVLGDTTAAPTVFDDVAAGVGIATNGVAAGQTLQVRLVPIGDPSRPVLPSAWFTVSTAEILVGGLTPAGKAQLVEDLAAQLDGAAAAERLAETLLQTILDEQQAYETEADRRMNADVGVFSEATSYTTGSIAEAMNLVYTKAQTDDGLATTLQVAKSYADTLKSESELLFSTKTERANGDAAAVLQAKAYTDDFKAEASLTYATQAALGSGLSSTLSAAQSYTNGSISTALSTVYTRAEVDGGLATTLSASRSYTDALRSDANTTFATTSALGGVSASASLALSTATAANGTANATFGLATDVNGYIAGFKSVNTGTFSTFYMLTDVFGLFAPSGGPRSEYINGVWYFYPADNLTRTMIGKPFGGSYGLVVWCGPNSVPIGSENKGNAYVYISTNTFGGGRFGGSDVGGGTAPLQATASAEVAYGFSAPGGGFAGSSTITITPSGSGAGGATCRWTKVDGDAAVGISASGFSASFFGTVPPGGMIRAFYLAVIYSAGQSVTLLIDVQLSDPT